MEPAAIVIISYQTSYYAVAHSSVHMQKVLPNFFICAKSNKLGQIGIKKKEQEQESFQTKVGCVDVKQYPLVLLTWDLKGLQSY